MQVKESNVTIFGVVDNQKTYTVDLSKKSCTCNKFQIQEIPCAHAAAVLRKLHQQPYEYCSIYHKKETMLATYKETVYPIPGREQWDIPEEIKKIVVLPPHGKVQLGRPRKRRLRAKSEKKSTHKCGNCREQGHNKRKCKNVPHAG